MATTTQKTATFAELAIGATFRLAGTVERLKKVRTDAWTDERRYTAVTCIGQEIRWVSDLAAVVTV